MDRNDFLKRGELKVDFLKYYRLVSRWACKQYELTISDLELLFYLDPIKYFTIQDFKNGTLYYHWDRQRFYRLQREGWIEKIHKGNGRLGDHNKYKVTMRGKRMINILLIIRLPRIVTLYLLWSPKRPLPLCIFSIQPSLCSL